MQRHPALAAIAATVLALTGALVGSTAASAAPAYPSREDCTIHARTGRLIVTADWHRNGLTKTGFVWIQSVDQAPFLILVDRVGPQRGVGGMASPGVVRSWAVRYPVLITTHVGVRVRGSDGSTAGCVTH